MPTTMDLSTEEFKEFMADFYPTIERYETARAIEKNLRRQKHEKQL
jgi:hypothetical protein